MADEKGSGTTVLAGSAAVLSVAALIAALGRKVEAGTTPTEEEIQEALVALAAQNEYISDRLKVVESLAGVEAMPEEVGVAAIPFTFNLAPNQAVVLTEPVAFATYVTGYIKQVTIHYPNGCNALVNVRVGYQNLQFLPSSGFLALNDATPTYPFNVLVVAGQNIWVEMQNTDGVNPHNITVTISVVEWKT